MLVLLEVVVVVVSAETASLFYCEFTKVVVTDMFEKVKNDPPNSVLVLPKVLVSVQGYLSFTS